MPDYLLIKKEIDPFTNSISYDVKYIDAKYLPDFPFSVNQAEIVNEIKNNGVSNCNAFDDIKDINGNRILKKGELLQIKTVEKLTIDNLMNLVIK